MNEAEKERLIKKDIESIENRVRHAFNQGYEMGLKAYKEQSGDAISREELIEALNTWDKFGYAPTNELIPLRGNADKDKYVPYIHWDDVLTCIRNMPSVTPQQRTDADALDKIRAEIENDWQLKEYPSSPFSCGLRRTIEIIDKYRAESEEQE